MPRLEPVTKATLPRNLRSMTPSASVYLDRTQRGRVLTCASQHVICVGAGDHEPRSKPDQFALQHRVVANTADPQHLVMHPAGGGHPFVGGAQPWMVNLSGNAEIGRQVTRADQQNVDPVDRQLPLRNSRSPPLLCSVSERPLAVISAVVIEFLPKGCQAYKELPVVVLPALMREAFPHALMLSEGKINIKQPA